MAGLLGFLAVLVVFTLPPKLGAGVSSRTIKEFLSKSSAINTIALARIFLFGARDTWFVVAFPVFLYANGWSFWEVGGFLALWTMLYGLVQGMAPAIMRITAATPVSWTSIVGWAVALALALIGILICMIVKMDVPLLIIGLLVFGVFFAVNSSLHSFLIVAYAGSKKAAEDIGFYYAANAAGRLAGTFLSGFLYYQGGLLACLAGSALFLIITALMVARLPQLEA